MKRLLLIVYILCATALAASDVRVFWWQESRDEKTGEKQFGFFIAPQIVKEMFEADARHDEKATAAIAATLPKDAWDYALMLTGEAKSYSKEQITLIVPSPCGDIIKIASGSIEVDRTKNSVSIALKVEEEGHIVAFKGNGVYPIEKAPNQSPEPTPLVVTPRAEPRVAPTKGVAHL